MNEQFVNVKVDREERPDVDAVYMDYVQAMTGHGGWPMTTFLTPEGEAFYAGTYFPPTPRHGTPSFSQLLTAIAATWAERKDEAQQAAARITEALAERTQSTAEGTAPPDAVALADAVRQLAPDVRPGPRRIRWRPQVPAVDGARVAAPPPRAHR